jgi:hypothetical protein
MQKNSPKLIFFAQQTDTTSCGQKIHAESEDYANKFSVGSVLIENNQNSLSIQVSDYIIL